MFNALSRLFTGGQAPPDEIEGALWAHSDVGGDQLMFMFAVAKIEQGSTQFDHNLVISRVVEDDVNHLVFPITMDTMFQAFEDHFRVRQGQRTYALAVEDDASSKRLLRAFEKAVMLKLFEARHQRPAANATEEDLQALENEVRTLAERPNDSSSGSARTGAAPQTPQQAPQTASCKPQTPATSSATAVPPGILPPVSGSREGDVVAKAKADFHYFNVEQKSFLPLQLQSDVFINSTGPCKFTMYMCNGEKVLKSMTPKDFFWEKEHSAIMWNDVVGDGLVTYSIKFHDQASFTNFSDALVKAVFETNTGVPITKQYKDEGDVDYVRNMATGYEMDIDEPEERAEESEEEYESATDGESDDDDRHAAHEPAGPRNSNLTVGLKHNRAFVSRENNIGVFRANVEDGAMEFVHTISNVVDTRGNRLVPAKLLMHNQDQDMLLMKPGDNKTIFKMDVERGQVVDEWKTHEIIGVDEIAPHTKYAQLTSDQLLVGLNHSRVMMLDGRLAGDKVVESQSYSYTSKPDLSCIATTGQGFVAIGSEKGEIRFFNKISMKAKTLLPGLGDPITGIDVSEDGKWVLATCKKYLILVSTAFTDDKSGKSSIGFEKSMGKNKPKPMLLRVRPEHATLMGREVSFTVARFNTGDRGEKFIVASTGPYVLQWDMKKVKKGNSEYVIKKYKNDVVGDQFAHNQEKNIVVALENDITMATKNQFVTPKKLGFDRNTIVNSPW